MAAAAREIYADYWQWEQAQSEALPPAAPARTAKPAAIPRTDSPKKKLGYLDAREFEQMEERILEAERGSRRSARRHAGARCGYRRRAPPRLLRESPGGRGARGGALRALGGTGSQEAIAAAAPSYTTAIPQPAQKAKPIPAVAPPAARWKPWAILFAIALVAYADSFGLGLAQDSKVIVTQDPRLRAATAENFGLILTRNYWWPKAGDGLYRPVTTATFLLNYAVLGNGPSPAGYHWLNFLLHAINACLVYQLALLIFRRGWPAFGAAALWAVHPICTEAVDNIVGRADLAGGHVGPGRTAALPPRPGPGGPSSDRWPRWLFSPSPPRAYSPRKTRPCCWA